MMTPREESLCLSHDPWGWDETPYVLLRDGFVTARKYHRCHCCRHMIRPGQRVRSRAEIDKDEQRRGTFYWCIQCCEAQARVQFDAGLSLERRYSMGMAADNTWPV